MNKTIKQSLIPIITIVVSIILGVIFKNGFLSILTLIFGFLNSYYMAIGKWHNYIFGLLFAITYGLICAFNGLYGWGIFAIVFYVPSQVMGMINWKKNNRNRAFDFFICFSR